MKKLIVLIFMLLPLGVFAQDKIAIVNTADIFNIMPEVSAVEKQLATLNEQYEKEFKTMRTNTRRSIRNICRSRIR